uniref:Uncharacterized protein n=1 Tax=Cacopsylla melanoneura TaxID=428564 RepID=A0A8D8W163_9HEMI
MTKIPTMKRETRKKRTIRRNRRRKKLVRRRNRMDRCILQPIVCPVLSIFSVTWTRLCSMSVKKRCDPSRKHSKHWMILIELSVLRIRWRTPCSLCYRLVSKSTKHWLSTKTPPS